MADFEAPLVSQNVRWGESYVSHGLNRKFFGLIRPGIYRGYWLKPGPAQHVFVDNDEDRLSSMAVVERDGYNLTITMDGNGYVRIPTAGHWYICIEAFYSPRQQGYQRLVARQEEDLEDWHIILGEVNITEAQFSKPITEEQISLDSRQYCNPMGDLSREAQADLLKMSMNQAELARQMVRLSTRVMHLEIGDNGTTGGSVSPAGYLLSNGATVAPVTVMSENTLVPPEGDPAITFITN